MDYSCLSLDVPSGADCQYILEQAKKIEDRVVVNLALSAEGSQLIFTEENLQVMLQSDPNILYLITVPELQYIEMIKQQLLKLQSEIKDLRSKLCKSYVSEFEGEFASLLSTIENISLLMACFALKKNNSIIRDIIREISQEKENLGVACFYLEDNVLCMDILHYRIGKMVKKLFDELK